MRRLRIGVSSITMAGLVLLAACGAWAQTSATAPPPTDLLFYGGGARAAAMGGAYVAIADDAGAGYWNPAGLTQNDRVYTGLQFRYQRHRVQNKLDSPEPLDILYDNVSRQNIWDLTFAAFNAPLMVKGQRFYLSASWMRAQDDNFLASQDFPSVAGIFLNVPDAPSLSGYLTNVESYSESKGGAKVATLAAATQLKEEVFSAGFALNIFIGSGYDSTRTTLGIDRIYQQLQIDEDVTNRKDYLGVNFGLGFLYQADQYSFGLAVKSPFKLQTEFDRRVANFVYERTADSLLFRSTGSTLFKFKSKTEMPVQVAFGVAYRPQENLILSADYEFKNFGASKVLIQEDVLDPRSDYVSQDPQWKDVHQVRLGLEYQVATSFGIVPLRAGFRTEPLPYRQITNAVDSMSSLTGGNLTYTLGDQQFGQVYSLGTGIHWNQVRLDLTYEYLSVTSYMDGYFVDDPLKPAYIGLQDNRKQRVSLGFTGFF